MREFGNSRVLSREFPQITDTVVWHPDSSCQDIPPWFKTSKAISVLSGQTRCSQNYLKSNGSDGRAVSAEAVASV